MTGFAEIDLKRNFANLGVDSLRLMQIVVRLRPLADASVGIGRLLVAKTAEELMRLVEAGSAGDAPRGGVLASDHDLSTPQERLWYLAQLDPHSPSYNVPFGWLFPAHLRTQVLGAVSAVLERHEMLRSAYREDVDGRPCRTVVATSEIPISETQLDPTDPTGSFQRAARDIVKAPFDLHVGCTRVMLACDDSGIRLLFVCHHIAVDAWSVKLMGDELHRAVAATEPPPSRQLARYSDFVRWERVTRNGAEFERLAQHWRESLGGLKPTVPPFDEIPDRTDDHRLGIREIVLGPDCLASLRTVLRNEGATLYAAALTGLAVALGAWCKTPEVVVGTNLANRMREEFESVVGLFVDPVVLRLAPGLDDPATTLRAALAKTGDRLTSAVAHSGIPYLDVVRILGRPRSEGDNPLFSVMATMFDTNGDGISALDVPLPAHAKFPLAVEFLPRADGLLVHVLFAADCYRVSSIDKLLQNIVGYLDLLAKGGANALLSSLVEKSHADSARTRFAQRFDQLGSRS